MVILSALMILIGGFLAGLLFHKIKLPKMVGMLVYGILIGPSLLNLVDPLIISFSSTLRLIALAIILTRSGLSLNLNHLKKLGVTAILMCVVPATFEMIGVLILAPLLLHISILESLLLGAVLAAVSPAIVVPRMIKIKHEGYGKQNHIPELVLAGASADDIYVITLFYMFLGFNTNTSLNVFSILAVPVSIILGMIYGISFGIIISRIFKRYQFNVYIKVAITLTLSFIFIYIEGLGAYIPFSAMIGIVTLGMTILYNNQVQAKELETEYKKLWFVFEIILFVLVGVSVDLNYTLSAGWMMIVVLIGALLFRMLGVYVSLLWTEFSFKEKIFTMISYIPKATVQASIGGIALSSGLGVGALILTMAVLSILITAPIGSLGIDLSYTLLLSLDTPIEPRESIETVS